MVFNLIMPLVLFLLLPAWLQVVSLIPGLRRKMALHFVDLS